jgi:hypothetical protein
MCGGSRNSCTNPGRRDQHLVPTGDERNSLSTVFSGSDTSGALGSPKGLLERVAYLGGLKMKYLLGGAALAALAIAVPVWAAQAPTSSSAPSTAQPAPEAQKPRPYTQAHHGRYVHHVRYVHHAHHRGYHHWARRGPTDTVANRLNRAELSGMLSGSSMPPAGYQPAPDYPPTGYMPPAYMPGGPRPSGH